MTISYDAGYLNADRRKDEGSKPDPMLDLDVLCSRRGGGTM